MSERDNAPEARRTVVYGSRRLLRAGLFTTRLREPLPDYRFEPVKDEHVDAEPRSNPELRGSEAPGEQQGSDRAGGQSSPRPDAGDEADNEGSTGSGEPPKPTRDPNEREAPSERIPETDSGTGVESEGPEGEPDTNLDELGDQIDQMASVEEEVEGGYGSHPGLHIGPQGQFYHPWAEVESTTDGEP